MEKETDDKVAVAMVDAAQKKFPNLKGCSFDKGFYSPGNKKELKDMLETLVLPKKGKRNKVKLSKNSEKITHSKNCFEREIAATICDVGRGLRKDFSVRH